MSGWMEKSTVSDQTERFRQYLEYMDRVKQSGARVLTFNCPHCGAVIETTAPERKGEKWGTGSVCPHCEEMFFKVVTRTRAEGRIPGKEEATK